MLRWSIRLVHSLLLILLPHLRQVCCAPAAHLVHHRSYSCRCTMQTHSPCFYPTTRCKVLQSAGSHPKYCPQEKNRKEEERKELISFHDLRSIKFLLLFLKVLCLVTCRGEQSLPGRRRNKALWRRSRAGARLRRRRGPSSPHTTLAGSTTLQSPENPVSLIYPYMHHQAAHALAIGTAT